MKISPIVLLLVIVLGCGSGTQPAKPSAESGGNQAQQQKVATPGTQVATAAEKAAAAEAVKKYKKHMTPAQLELGDPIVNSIGILLVPIPAGEFQMGSPDSIRERPQHLVKITKPFYLGAFEVTQSQYEKVMGVRPWQDPPFKVGPDHPAGPDYPATEVSWHNAVEFCLKLSEQEGVEYRLPTEAQWEYACRARTTTVYSFGDDASKLGQHAWYDKNARDIGENYPHRVGQKLPNSWGLYDMHGNVWEWCQDWYAPYGPEKVVIDLMGPEQGKSRVYRDGSRVFRGGCFAHPADNAPSVNRNDSNPGGSVGGIVGYRVVRTYP
jgi:formylglycine-generating enzyme required for sulfatase activity